MTTASSPSFRRGNGTKHMTAQEVAERSQRQLGIVAVFGSLIPVIIVVTFIVFHFTRGGALTGSSVIEREKHIVHEYKMGHHRDALRDLNDLIRSKPYHHSMQHLQLMEKLLRKSNLQAAASSSGGEERVLFKEIEFALEAVAELRKDPDDSKALNHLDGHIHSILSLSGGRKRDTSADNDNKSKKKKDEL